MQCKDLSHHSLLNTHYLYYIIETYFIEQQSQNNENINNKSKKKFKALSLGNDIPVEKNDISKPQDPSTGKKKPKFVNLYSQEGQNKETILLKGVF